MKDYSVNERRYLEFYLSGVTQGERSASEAAAVLFDKYGSLGRVMARSYGEIESVAGASAATALKLLGCITSRRFTDELKMGKRYGEEEICEYLRWLYLGRDVECVYILLLDKNSKLLCVTKISEGTVNSSDIIPRRALEAVARLKSKAKFAIMAHNHPGGVVSVSESDAYATAVMKQALAGVGVELIRHIVVADKDVEFIDV